MLIRRWRNCARCGLNRKSDIASYAALKLNQNHVVYHAMCSASIGNVVTSFDITVDGIDFDYNAGNIE